MPKDAYHTFLDNIKDKYGEEIIVATEPEKVEAIPTGAVSLDASIGIGGIPRGKITEIFGAESSGKTTLALSICKNAVNQDLKVLYIDVENMIDYSYAYTLVGQKLDPEHFIILQPDTAEDAFSMAEDGIDSGQFGLVVFDSIGALAPKKEKEDEFADANVALVPRLMSKFLRRNAFKIRTNNIAFLFINQVRDTIGSYMQTYSMPGGHALKHYCSVIMMLSKGIDIKAGNEVIGINTKFSIKKNKLAPPFRTFIIPIIFGKGVDTSRDLLSFAEMLGIVTKAGAYYKFEDANLGRGLLDSCVFVESNPLVLDKIVKKVYDNINKYDKEISVDEDEVEEPEEKES
jgi:recombination protein RecA